MTPKEINDLKKLHNKYQSEGQELYAKLLELHKNCMDLQDQLMEAEGDDYDPLPLIFGAGFLLDPNL